MSVDDVGLNWDEVEHDGRPLSASAIVELGSPASNPNVAPITIYLDVEEDEDDDEVGYSWRASISEEDAGFGDATLDSGWLPRYHDAKTACWSASVEYLRSDGYTDDEIVNSV